ncbi:hypothetical protein [Phosphitispora fastidiosa]|uniref:hypothetical protein n=1 Tax=Phosphitispora fastidiosa TaxID=2837202 RepID=UPI001E4EBACE|nr:hypothetical protein [Phosphitispora fastidiosa]MBU7006868.1 hypothetical protein [Phosphitispora fastidiosa]
MKNGTLKGKRIAILVLIAFMTALFATPAYAWHGSGEYATEQDVHLTDTYWWARDMGFAVNEAKTIARACDGVDFSWKYFDKDWHLDRREDSGDTIDTRERHAIQEMNKAKYYISKVPGSGYWKARYYRNEAWKHLGRGLHALQDIYGHMDAGVGKPIDDDRYPFSHGMAGVMVDATDVDGTVREMAVENLYDDVLWDYTEEEGWHRHHTKEEGTRWTETKKASKKYMYEFLSYGYGS